jgi:hypothetical protein
MEEERIYGYFMQNGFTSHTVNYSINVLYKAFDDLMTDWYVLDCGLQGLQT